MTQAAKNNPASVFIWRFVCYNDAMPLVKVSENETFDVAMRRFKRAVERAGLITEKRMRSAHEKPTTRRKRQKIAAVKRLRRMLRMQTLPVRKY